MYGQKFLRGQVWWVGTSKEYIGSVQSMNRPHVIVSNNVGNRCSEIVMVAPCTSELKRLDLPTHIECEINGKKNTIICEQIKTVNVNELLSYMFTLDNSVMDKVDDALGIAFGLANRKPIEVKSRKEEFVEDTIKQEEDTITNIVDLSVSKRGKYKVWDDDTKQEYINYYEENGRKATSERYGVGYSAKTYYFRFCRALNITPMDEQQLKLLDK